MNRILSIFLILFLQAPLFAQLKSEAIPASEHSGLSLPISTIVMEKPALEKPVLNRNDEPEPEYAGTTLLFNNHFLKKGVWEKTNDGTNVWRMQITVKNATRINLYFSDFHLMKNDLLFLYPPHQKVHKALTSKNNGAFLTSEIIRGNSVVVELNRFSEGRVLPFSIQDIGVIRPENSRDFGGAGACEVPVNCSEGASYKKQKNGVARILVKEGSGLYWCTGTLVNNTAVDGKGYFLTANHCGNNASGNDFLQWLFYFNYESPDCSRPSSEPAIHSLSGSQKLASAPNSTSAGSDFLLLLLNQPIPKSYKPYYNGWDKSGMSSNNGVTIHHPQGDIKMISTYGTPLIPGDYYGTISNTNGFYWKVQWGATEHGHGVTEGGSSGSPLFNSNGLIVGSLTGGDASCSQADAFDYYGRFWSSWHPLGSDSTGQLEYWLNRTGAQADILAGYDPNAGEVSVSFTATITKLPEGGKTGFVNLSTGNITAYHWTFDGGIPYSSNEKKPPAIIYPHQGKYSVSLTVEYDGGTKTSNKQEYIEVLPAIYPNPSASGIFTILTGEYEKEKVKVRIFAENGQEIGIFPPQFTTSGIIINMSNQKRGLYLLRIARGQTLSEYKVLISKTK